MSAIGSGDSQQHIIGPRTTGSGFGDKPSLPQHLRHADPLAGPWRAGEFLQGASAPLSSADAALLCKHFNFTPATGLPPSAEQLGAFLGNVEASRNLSFRNFLCGDSGMKWALRVLMDFNNWGPNSNMGIGMADIADACGRPGAGNHDMIYKLTRWAQVHPGTRAVLDAAVEKLLVEGRIPRNAKEPS